MLVTRGVSGALCPQRFAAHRSGVGRNLSLLLVVGSRGIAGIAGRGGVW